MVFRFGWLLCAAIALPPAARASVVYSDSVFNDADWSLPAYSFTGSVNTPPQGFQVASGGNSGPFRRINHNNFTNVIVTYHLRSGANYAPAVDGAISGIAFSADLLALVNHANVNVGVSLLAFQGGNYYYAPTAYFLNNSTTQWQSFARTLTAADFGLFNNAGAHPDFSAAGAPIQFGIAAFNDNTGTTTNPRAVAVDNWGVTVNPVPEPATLWLLGRGLAAGWARRFTWRR